MNTPQPTLEPSKMKKALDILSAKIKARQSAMSIATQRYNSEIADITDNFNEGDPVGSSLREAGILSTKPNRILLLETLKKKSVN